MNEPIHNPKLLILDEPTTAGNINDLISVLSGSNIINLMIEEPSLEEIFMHYYKL